MKAIILEKAGGTENLHFAEVAKPSIKDHEVLVATKALSIIWLTLKVFDDLNQMMFGDVRPVILGWI
jgi:NADPH:quinone reductase-like Zn-dependent oxidoreductase